MPKNPSAKPKSKGRSSSPAKPKPKQKIPTVKKDPAKEFGAWVSTVSSGIAQVVTLDDPDCLAGVPMHFSTGSLALDRLLNGKGIPSGRVTEFFGPPYVGKSTLLDQVYAQAQAMGGQAVLIEPETARTQGYSKRLGVYSDKLHYIQYKDRDDMHLENIMSLFYDMIDFWRKESPDTPVVIGLDALGGTATRDEIQNRLKKANQPGAAAKVVREAARQIPSKLGNTKIALIICNHEYDKIATGGFVGKKRETYGGGGLRHLASVRVSLFPTSDYVKDGAGTRLGRIHGAKLVKNRLADPTKSEFSLMPEARFAIMSGRGVNNVWTIYQDFIQAGYITLSGSWAALNLGEEVLKFQGWLGLQKKCAEDSTLFPRLVAAYKTL